MVLLNEIVPTEIISCLGSIPLVVCHDSHTITTDYGGLYRFSFNQKSIISLLQCSDCAQVCFVSSKRFPTLFFK